mgnify:FL=1
MIKNYVRKYEKYSSIISILMIIVSLFLIFKPVKSLEFIVLIFGVILIANGLMRIVSYFNIDNEMRLMSLDLLEGIITILTGTLTLVYRQDLINVFPVILGIWIIAKNIVKLQFAINLSTIPNSGWGWLIVLSILTIILGIIIIINPFSTLIAITLLSGILLLVTELCDLIESIYVLIKLK